MAGEGWSRPDYVVAAIIILSSLVVVGETAADLVSIQRGGQEICLGKVLDNERVHFSASCLQPMDYTSSSLSPIQCWNSEAWTGRRWGIDDLETLTVVYGSGETRGIIEIRVNPNLDPRQLGYEAVLKVDRPVEFSKDVQPGDFGDEGDVIVSAGTPELSLLVSIQHGGKHICMGRMLDSQLVYVYHTCLEGINPKTLTVMYANSETRGVIDFRIDPVWDPRAGTHKDQAVLQVDRPVQPAPYANKEDGQAFLSHTLGPGGK